MLRLLAAMAFGALLLALAYQIPVSHSVDIGGYDAAYTQGFYDPERNRPNEQRPELDGSDGSARWTGASSFLVFPQAGLPAQITLRLRGWRNGGAPPEVAVLLNGTRELARFQAGAAWQDHSVAIDGGLLKPNDLVIEIRSGTAQLDPDDPRQVGVLLDRASYRVGPAPIAPYPPQLLYGALASGMLYVLLVMTKQADKQTSSAKSQLLVAWSAALSIWLGSVIALALGFLLLYRAQLAYPYPLLRLLPALDGLLAALLALRYGPALARRVPALLDLLAVSGLGAWLVAVLVAAQRHLTLSVPGVEKDFHVFALRSARLAGTFQPSGSYPAEVDGVFRADGFYNLGYPLLLWFARRLTNDNPFLAARLLAALSAALLLAAGWWLARRMLGSGPALIALLVLALSPLVVEYSLYIGSDMPFAALCTLALALLLPLGNHGSGAAENCPGANTQLQTTTPRWPIAAAGFVAGLAFLMRHPGVLLLPFGCLSIWLNWNCDLECVTQARWNKFKSSIRNAQFPILLFALAFALAIAPQLYVNIRDVGQPFYNQQAKNIWQAVYGNGDWGRWGEATNTIGLAEVIAQDPQRFLTNWSINLRGFVGSGGEDTREFGQAAQLRLLGFPANWLAVAGLLGWLVAEGKRRKENGNNAAAQPFYLLPFTLLLWIALYVVAISAGLALQGRFLLPLAPIYALAAAWAIARVAERAANAQLAKRAGRAPMLFAGLLLLALLQGGFADGADYVLRSRAANEPALARAQGRAENPGQPADEAAIVERALARLQPGERLIVRAPAGVPIGKYSPIAHLAVPAPASDEPAALRATGARYLIWSGALGRAPRAGERVDAAGIYELYRIE